MSSGLWFANALKIFTGHLESPVANSLGGKGLLWPLSLFPWRVFDPVSIRQTRSSRPVSGSFCSTTSPRHSFLDSSLARKPKCNQGTIKGSSPGPEDRGLQTGQFQRAYFALLRSVPVLRLACYQDRSGQGSFV